MRTIDRFVGIPLCWLAGLFLKTLRPGIGRRSDSRWNTILVIKFFGMGSILLSTPFLSALRRHAPQARIVYLSFSANRELIERFPEVDRTLTISTASPLSFIRDTLSAILSLRRMSVDTAFDLEFFSKFSTLVASLSGAQVRVGFSLPALWRRINLTHPVPFAHSTHATQLFLTQLSQFTRDLQPADVRTLASDPKEQQSMKRKLRLESDGFTIIAININAGQASLERRWDPDQFMEVAMRLMERVDSPRLFFTGSLAEFGYISRALERYPQLHPVSMNCAGLLNIGELIALFERTAVFLTNDTGPMHLAASVGTPVVALFGPESPEFYSPTGTTRIIYKRLACSPCLNVYNAKLFVCPYNARCMKEISATEVLEAVSSLLPSLTPEPERV